MDEIYLRIFVDPDYRTDGRADPQLHFEGTGCDADAQHRRDLPGWYPDRWDDEVKRIGNTVVGAEHILISEEAKRAIRYICEKTKHKSDDRVYFDIDLWFGGEPDVRYRVDRRDPQIRLYYGGSGSDAFPILHPDLPIGEHRRAPMLRLLDELPTAPNADLLSWYHQSREQALASLSPADRAHLDSIVAAWLSSDTP